jgi:hypothetical protein
MGDGKTTLGKLVENDRRAGLIKDVYLKRHEKLLDDVIPKDQNFAWPSPAVIDAEPYSVMGINISPNK